MDTYNIVRFYADENTPEVIVQSGVSLAEAKAHCRSDESGEAGVWFDGFRLDNGGDEPEPFQVEIEAFSNIFG